MEKEDVLDLFKEHGGLLTGHFKLSSGLHSDTYLQCAKVLTDTVVATRLGQALAKGVTTAMGGSPIDRVISPALGGVIIGHEVARALHKLHIFSERKDGQMTIRRGFEIEEGKNYLLVEDVVTTGKSSGEVIALVETAGGKVAGACSIINRSGKLNPFAQWDIPYACLAPVDAQAWPEDQLPPELAAIPVTAPGSRFQKG